jgi:UDP-N-acetylglucosamine acyltransferase
MGGHVRIGDNAIVGGASAIHQFVRIGRGAIIGGMSGVERDVIPFGSVTGNRASLDGLNIVGLKRRGFQRAAIHALRAAFRELFLGEGVFADRLSEVRAQFGDEPLVGEVLAFIDAPSKRGLIRSAVASDMEEDEVVAAASAV